VQIWKAKKRNNTVHEPDFCIMSFSAGQTARVMRQPVQGRNNRRAWRRFSGETAQYG
jgi:hypothetical protein